MSTLPASHTRFRLSVRGKLVALLGGTSFLALLIACSAFVYYDRVTYAEAKERTLSVLADSVSHSAFGPTAFQDADSAKVILKVLAAEPSALAGGIYTQDGALLASWQRKQTGLRLPATRGALPAKSGFIDRELRITRPIRGEQTVGVLHVVFSTADIQARTVRFLQIASAVLTFSVLLALVFATLAQRVLTRPVTILATAARRVQQHQDFDARAERVSDDELGQLTDAFNAMLSMIQVRDRELELHRAGLEEQVRERTRDLDRRNEELRLVLDNVDQGLLMVDRGGMPSGERSASFDNWFGAPEPGQGLGAIVARRAAGFDRALAMQWEQLVDGFLPVELTLSQMPADVSADDGRHYHLAYRAIGEDPEHFEKLLVVVSDVTASVEQALSDAEQSQLIAVLEHISADRGGFLSFFREAEAIVERLCGTDAAPRDRTVVMRELHTLKGNFGLFGLKTLALLVHEIEDVCQERGDGPSADDLTSLQIAWQRLAQRAQSLLGDNTHAANVDRTSLEELLAAIRDRRPEAELQALATRLSYEPVAPKLLRMGERARSLADRLGKGPVEVDVQAEGVVAPAELNWLWQVLPHVVANSVDHGLDAHAERVANGKQAQGKLRIAAIEQPTGLVIEVEDDGRGIDWEKVRARAQKLGLPADTHEQLVRALFADGVTTREQATDVSGRGVGLAAVEAACEAHGTHIGVVSRPGKGTLFRFTVENDNRVSSRRKAS